MHLTARTLDFLRINRSCCQTLFCKLNIYGPCQNNGIYKTSVKQTRTFTKQVVKKGAMCIGGSPRKTAHIVG